MTPTQKKLKQAESDLAEALRNKSYWEGIADERQTKLSKLERSGEDTMMMVRDQQRDMQSQLEWMRQLVEVITVPADKMAQLDALREKRYADQNGLSYEEMIRRRGR